MESYLSGYHRCCLEKPYYLDYASQDLCDILGYTSDEIHTLFHDKYSQMVHADDRKRYLQFIEKLASKEQTLSLQYRMICKDGHMIRLNDTMSSRRLEDGRMYGFAIVADITDAQQPQTGLALDISAQIVDSCGYMQCTCEKYPKITHINAQMRKYLGVSEQDYDWHDFLKDNLFLMLPFEERDMFRNYMDQAMSLRKPISIRHHFFCKNGRKLVLNGWMSSIKNQLGETEYALIYMKVENAQKSSRKIADNSYFHALKSAYNVIFEINFVRQTVECIHGRDTSYIGPLYDVHMTIESAKNFWLNHYIIEEDREVMQDFLERVSNPPEGWRGSSVIQAEFRFKWSDNIVYKMIGVAVQLDLSTVLLCCRDITNVKYAALPGKESIALNKMQTWIDYFVAREKSALGLLIFEKNKTGYSISYISKPVCEYLGLGRNEYLNYISGELSAEHFLETISVYPCSPEDLIRNGQTILTIKGKQKSDALDTRQVRLSCSVYTCDEENLYEVLIYDKASSEEDSDDSRPHIFARTFGHFDLFLDGVPVVFSNQKEKEFMALLIDRNGGTVTTSEAINYLWENEEVSNQVVRRYRKLCSTLKNTLEKYRIEYLVINHHGTRSIDVSALTCDYYELLAGNQKYRELFHNVYMPDYSWAEDTLASLWDYS
jgi:PAS domain S-box-containing protein